MGILGGLTRPVNSLVQASKQSKAQKIKSVKVKVKLTDPKLPKKVDKDADKD